MARTKKNIESEQVEEQKVESVEVEVEAKKFVYNENEEQVEINGKIYLRWTDSNGVTYTEPVAI